MFIKSLEGKFSAGNIKAVGELPIFDNPKLKIDVPLTVDLQQLLLNLKGLYQGGANGNLAITGSLLKPIIGGNIELFNGQVLLTESPDNNSYASKINDQNKADTENKIIRWNNL